METRDCLPLVEPHVAESLISPAAWEAVKALASGLPPHLAAGFECRLHDDGQVDVSILLLRENAVLPVHLGADPVWRSVQAVCGRWRDPHSILYTAVQDIWLEFDLDKPGQPVPGMFLTLKRGVNADLPALVEEVAASFGASAPHGVRENLPRVRAALPEGGTVVRLGMMFGRGATVTRVEVNLPRGEVLAYLERVGWRESAGALPVVLDCLADRVDILNLDLDIGNSVAPRLGLECLLSKPPRREPRWAALMDYAVEAGLCLREKAEAVLAWPGAVRVPKVGNVVTTSALEGAERVDLCIRLISHIKFVYEGGRLRAAKAYLYYRHMACDESFLDTLRVRR